MNTWGTAVALLLLIEGLMPFIAPQAWRNFLRRLTQLSDRKVRFIGLTSVLLGLLVLHIIK